MDRPLSVSAYILAGNPFVLGNAGSDNHYTYSLRRDSRSAHTYIVEHIWDTYEDYCEPIGIYDDERHTFRLLPGMSTNPTHPTYPRYVRWIKCLLEEGIDTHRPQWEIII